MPEKRVGKVEHYYPKVKAAAVGLSGPLKVGDKVHIVGHGDDFEEKVTSLQLDHAPIEEGRPGQSIGLAVEKRVHEGDDVYVVESGLGGSAVRSPRKTSTGTVKRTNTRKVARRTTGRRSAARKPARRSTGRKAVSKAAAKRTRRKTAGKKARRKAAPRARRKTASKPAGRKTATKRTGRKAATKRSRSTTRKSAKRSPKRGPKTTRKTARRRR